MLKRMCRSCCVRPVLPPRSAFAGFRFPREVIVLAVRWYLRYGLSYRDVEELLAETRSAGRPRQHLSVGAALPAVVDRRSTTLPPRRRRSLVRRRNLRQDRRAVGVSV